MRRRGLSFRFGAGAAAAAVLWLASLGTAIAQTSPQVPPAGSEQIPGEELIPQPSLSPSAGQIAPESVLPPGTDPTGVLQPPGGDPEPNGSVTGGSGHSGAGGTGATRGGITGGTVTGSGGATLRDPSRATTIGDPLREFEDRDDSLGAVAGRAVRLAVPLAAPIGLALLGIAGMLLMAKGSGRLESLESEKEALGGRAVIRL